MCYIASISYGKDSLKMLDVIYTRGLPLDRIITFDVWATDTIPADFPEVIQFKNSVDDYIKNKYGFIVEHLYSKYPDGSKMTYEKEFYRVYDHGKKEGKIYGFPFLCGPWCNSRLKLRAKVGVVSKGDVEYIGLAYDEKIRHKIINQTIRAPLEEFGIDEDLCGLYCMYENILSPCYESSYRNGCWFCHNQGIDQLRLLRLRYPDLWQLLLKWDLDSPVSFKSDGHTVHDFDKRFQLEDEMLIFPDAPFRWKMLDEPLQIRFF